MAGPAGTPSAVRPAMRPASSAPSPPGTGAALASSRGVGELRQHEVEHQEGARQAQDALPGEPGERGRLGGRYVAGRAHLGGEVVHEVRPAAGAQGGAPGARRGLPGAGLVVAGDLAAGGARADQGERLQVRQADHVSLAGWGLPFIRARFSASSSWTRRSTSTGSTPRARPMWMDHTSERTLVSKSRSARTFSRAACRF